MLRRTKAVPGESCRFGSKTALALRTYLWARARHPGAGSAALFLCQAGRRRLAERGGGLAGMLARRCEAAGLRCSTRIDSGTPGPRTCSHTCR